MDELEELFRESFEQHADEVDTNIVVPGRRTRRWVAPLAAAAAVVIVATGVALVRDAPREADRPPQPGPAPAVPADWRVEQWHGVQVSVPPDWGWGGAPMKDNLDGRDTGDLIDCGGAAYVDASGKKLLNGDRNLPYVGRPQYMTDMCATYDPERAPSPTAPYVWLGAPLSAGTRQLAGGWTQETVEVAGERVTVATDDDELRGQILGSARANDESRCTTSTDGVWPRAAGRLTSAPTRMDVCAYVQEDGGRKLVYSTTVGRAAEASFLNAIEQAPTHTCIDSYNTEWVALRVHGESGETRVFVAALRDCIGIDDGEGLRDLTVDDVEPWAVDGIAAYLTGPGGPRLSQYFRGMLG